MLHFIVLFDAYVIHGQYAGLFQKYKAYSRYHLLDVIAAFLIALPTEIRKLNK